jgi:hypothetical protein
VIQRVCRCGRSVTPDDIVVKYTYVGDANLDGAVTFDYYAAMDAAFFGLIPNLGWATGDINFDNVINFDDYSKVDQAFFFQGTPLRVQNGDVASVSEPRTLMVFGWAATLGLCFYASRCHGGRFRRGIDMPSNLSS